jgi:hypothetical protein
MADRAAGRPAHAAAACVRAHGSLYSVKALCFPATLRRSMTIGSCADWSAGASATACRSWVGWQAAAYRALQSLRLRPCQRARARARRHQPSRHAQRPPRPAASAPARAPRLGPGKAAILRQLVADAAPQLVVEVGAMAGAPGRRQQPQPEPLSRKPQPLPQHLPQHLPPSMDAPRTSDRKRTQSQFQGATETELRGGGGTQDRAEPGQASSRSRRCSRV